MQKTEMFRINDRVCHTNGQCGTVREVLGDHVTVRFDDGIYNTVPKSYLINLDDYLASLIKEKVQNV